MLNENMLHIEKLETILGYTFNNKGLLIEAVTHSSYAYEANLPYNYERLEYLGDAVIELIVSDYIVQNLHDLNEGAMSKLRSHTVNEVNLCKLAKQINLHDFILLGKGERTGDTQDKRSILADSFEAICAAIYIDGSYDEAKKFALPLLLLALDEGYDSGEYRDAKSELQEYSQKHYSCLPKYNIIATEGAEHSKTYTMEVSIKGMKAIASGHSIRSASKLAARKLLDIIENE